MTVQDPHPAHDGVTIFDSPTFDKDLQIHVDRPIGSATISPSGRDVALASKHGLYIIDLDSPFSPPRHLRNETPWTPADVQWSPFASRYYWVVSTSNQRALVWNLELSASTPIELVLHAHYRAITDINFSPFHPDILATCAVDGFVHSWDMRTPSRPAISFSDWFAGAAQVKFNRADSHIVASSHDRFLRIWDDRNGAVPLKSIDAHATKIYGIDWSRMDSSTIITCSLDRTIKVWDWQESDKMPKRTIRTPYPVWRARHTPFGDGILAMPQRGDHRLHLFDGRYDHISLENQDVEPVYSFKGHGDSVKEFLWRARGTIHDNIDDRDFQLVSWGADHELILHKMRDKYFSQVGHEKGMHIERQTLLTRRGSPYKSFRDAPAPTHTSFEGHVPWQKLDSGASTILSEHTTPAAAVTSTEHAKMTRPSDRWLDADKSKTNVIDWMRGVKFGKGPRINTKDAKKSLHLMSKIAGHHMTRETLSDEIIHVSDTFAKITFEDVDVKARSARLSLYGPWGSESKPAHVSLELRFPPGYPQTAAPLIGIGRSSALSDEKIEQIEQDLDKLAQAHLRHKIGCLDSVLSYLTGELTMKQCLAGLILDNETGMLGDRGDISSDEEDNLDDFTTTQSQTLITGESTTPLLTSNANVGIPKACGAIWASDGRLICFFPPKAQPPSLFDKVRLAPAPQEKSKVMHEGFGRLPINLDDKPLKTPTPVDTPGDSDSESDTDSSSSSDSDAGDGFPAFTTGLSRTRTWSKRFQVKAKMRSTSAEGSQQTSIGIPKPTTTGAPKTIVSIQIHDDVLPAKYSLAEQYKIFGSGIEVCEHNADVAQAHGYNTIADVWSLLSLIMSNEVPLTSLMLDNQKPTYVMARRALVQIQRKDTFELAFDDPTGVSNPSLWGHLKWGNHPFGNAWLIDAIFEHFERLADIQMLAMLACVLADPSDYFTGGDVDASRNLAASKSVWPGYSIPYFPSTDMALQGVKPLISVSSSFQPPDVSFGTYSSLESSDGTRDAETTANDLLTPFSMGSTPPFPLSRNNTGRSSIVASLSASPENKPPAPLSTTSSFAQSVWSRPFQLSASPPMRFRTSGDENLVSSLASSAGVAWGSVTMHGSAAARRPYQTEVDALDRDSSDDEAGPATPVHGVKVRLLHAMAFDDEGTADVPLLSGELRNRCIGYRDAYAELLEAWGLVLPATEVRKFNARFAESEDTASLAPWDDSQSQSTLMAPSAENSQALTVSRACVQCGLLQDDKKRTCARCGAGKRLLSCGVCAEPVRGLHKACLNCGHISHVECLLALEGYGDEGDGADAVGSCETGCGCPCSLFGALGLA